MSLDSYVALIDGLCFALWILVAASEDTFRETMVNAAGKLIDFKECHNMRRFILVTLIPRSEAVASGLTMVMVNGIAWIAVSVWLLPENTAVEGLTLIYIILAAAAGVLSIGLIAGLVILTLIYRVPVKAIFVTPDKRAKLLQEVSV